MNTYYPVYIQLREQPCVVIGGGNAKLLDPVPEGCEQVTNQDALRGAMRLLPGSDMQAVPQTTTWRIHR